MLTCTSEAWMLLLVNMTTDEMVVSGCHDFGPANMHGWLHIQRPTSAEACFAAPQEQPEAAGTCESFRPALQHDPGECAGDVDGGEHGPHLLWVVNETLSLLRLHCLNLNEPVLTVAPSAGPEDGQGQEGEAAGQQGQVRCAARGALCRDIQWSMRLLLPAICMWQGLTCLW